MTQGRLQKRMNGYGKLYTTIAGFAGVVYFDESSSYRRCVIPKGI